MTSTLSRPTRTRVVALFAAAAVAAPLVLATPSYAGGQMPNPVTGLSACNVQTGAPAIQWTITNSVNQVVTIDSATVSGAATGSVTFTPNPIDPEGTAQGTTNAPVGTTGAVTIIVVTSWDDGEFPQTTTSNATANLGPCQVPSTTTTSTTSTSTTSTTAPTTTTTAPPAAAVVVVTPTFTG